jgi:hypothetical protein
MSMRNPCTLSVLLALALAGLLPGQRDSARPGRMDRPGGFAAPGAAARRGASIPRRGPLAQSPPAPRPVAARLPVDRWNDMKPEQRETALAKLPPDRQQKIRDQIARFNSLPETEQQRLRERYERLQQMPPDKRDAVRRELRHFSETPVERRRELVREMRELRDLNDGDRRSRMASDGYRARYSPEERQMLQDLTDYLSPAPATAGLRKD